MFMRTERLFLRPVFPEDWRGVYRGIADENVVRNLARAPWPYSEDDAKQFCAKAREGDGHRFAITLPAEKDAPIIGLIGYDPREDGGYEIGYWIGRDWEGRGFATEAGQGVLQATDVMGIDTMAAGHFIDNPASGRVLRKLGFVETGEIRPLTSAGRGGAKVPCRRFVRVTGQTDDSYHPAAA